MPLSTNKAATAPYALPSDRNGPVKDRARFDVRFMAVADMQTYEARMDEATATTDNRECFSKIRDALAVGIVGWRNLVYPPAHEKAGTPIPFDFDELLLCGVLTEDELWALAWSYPSAVRPVTIDLKNSESAQPLEQGQSAPIAKPAA